MFDTDTQLLSEAYSRILGEGKALTPDQIAKKAQPAGSAGKKGEALPKNKTEDKATEETLEKVPYTDQHADNFNQDGEDTKVKDRYVVKENELPQKVDVKQAFTRSPEQIDAYEGLVMDTSIDFTNALIEINNQINKIGGDTIAPGMRREMGMILSRILDDFKRNKLPAADDVAPHRPDPEFEGGEEAGNILDDEDTAEGKIRLANQAREE